MKAYQLFQQNPHHPSLRFEPKHGVKNVWSVYVAANYRALGRMSDSGAEIEWYFIGTKTEYMKLLP
jgi:hypothetical protein